MLRANTTASRSIPSVWRAPFVKTGLKAPLDALWARGKAAALSVVSLWASTAHGAKHADKRPITHVIVLGDSISYGSGAESPNLGYAALLADNDDTRYPEDAGQDLRHRFGPDIQIINLAQVGATSYDMVQQQLPALLARFQADAEAGRDGLYMQDGHFVVPGHVLLLMTAGGNDVQDLIRQVNFSGGALGRSLVNIRTILDTLADDQLFSGGNHAYFSNVYDVTDGEDQLWSCMDGLAAPGLSRALGAWSHSYAVLAKEHGARMVDALHMFHGHGFNFDRPNNPHFDPTDTTLWVYYRDCIHPNNHGHHMLRRAFWQQIERDFGN